MNSSRTEYSINEKFLRDVALLEFPLTGSLHDIRLLAAIRRAVELTRFECSKIAYDAETHIDARDAILALTMEGVLPQ